MSHPIRFDLVRMGDFKIRFVLRDESGDVLSVGIDC